MVSMSKDDLINAARLGSLKLTNEELITYGEQLNKMFDFIDIIKEVDTSEVPETNQGLDLVNVFREDEIIESLTNEVALANASEASDGQFKVPTIIE